MSYSLLVRKNLSCTLVGLFWSLEAVVYKLNQYLMYGSLSPVARIDRSGNYRVEIVLSALTSLSK